MAIDAIRLDLTIRCDSCGKKARIKVKLDWRKFQIALGDRSERTLDDKDLPDLWEYHRSSGWGMTDYTRTQLLCGDCVRKWRDESVLEQMARHAAKPRRKKSKR